MTINAAEIALVLILFACIGILISMFTARRSKRLAPGQMTRLTCSGRWICPECRWICWVSYVDLSNSGTPICHDCDREMDLDRVA